MPDPCEDGTAFRAGRYFVIGMVTAASCGEGGEALATVSSGAKGLVKPTVSNAKLARYVDAFYKGLGNPYRIGTGTTADAVIWSTDWIKDVW